MKTRVLTARASTLDVYIITGPPSLSYAQIFCVGFVFGWCLLDRRWFLASYRLARRRRSSAARSLLT